MLVRTVIVEPLERSWRIHHEASSSVIECRGGFTEISIGQGRIIEPGYSTQPNPYVSETVQSAVELQEISFFLWSDVDQMHA